MVYPSYPPKYRFTLSGNFNEGTHTCNLDDILSKENNQSE